MQARIVAVLSVVGLLTLAACEPPPAPPSPEPATCGGIAARPCAGGFICIDDPRDDCDPRNGGADCGGICVAPDSRCGMRYSDPARQYVGTSAEACARIRFACAPGTEYFSDPCGCGCVKVGATAR
jgi:hypothetical protein